MRASLVMSGMSQGLRRNASMTVALVLNTTIALFFVGAALLANKEIVKFKDIYASKINVSVYLCPEPLKDLPEQYPNCPHKVTAAEIDALRKALKADKAVKSAVFVSEEEQTKKAVKSLPKEQIEPLGDDFVFPASFTVKLNDLRKDFDSFADRYAKFKGVDQVQNQFDTIKTVLDVIDKVRLFSIGMAGVVLIASVLVMFNTILVAAAQRKNETSIMRLVGAARWMVELPFMLEAMLATLLGGLMSGGLLYLGKHLILDNIFKVPVANGLIPDLSGTDVLWASGRSLLAGVILAMVTAFTTLRLYVKI